MLNSTVLVQFLGFVRSICEKGQVIFVSVIFLKIKRGGAGKKSVTDSVVTFTLCRYNTKLATFRYLTSKKVLLNICAAGLRTVLALCIWFHQSLCVPSCSLKNLGFMFIFVCDVVILF